MDENSKNVAVLVGKRVLADFKDEFKEFTTISPLYIALALCGVLWSSLLGLVVIVLAQAAFLAYQNYRDVENDIAFDLAQAEYERKQSEGESTESNITESTDVPPEDDRKV
jgi:hypothetical protein